MDTATELTGRSHQDREQLIMDHYDMVRRIAYRMVSRYPSCVEVDDLVTIGMLGLIDAVDRFEHDRSISFTAYARIRVQGAIVDELRKADWVPRSVRNRATNLQRTREHLTEKLGRRPEEEEVAGELGVGVTRLREMVRDSTVRTLVSIYERSHDDDDAVGDSIACDGPTPYDTATVMKVRELVAEVVSELSERDRALVELYYYRDLKFREIGEILGVTESRVSQLNTRLKKRIRERLAALVEAA